MSTKEFFPEGWKEEREIYQADLLQSLKNGDILEAKPTRCDLQYNLHFQFGNGITGILPKEEVEENADPKRYFGKVGKVLQFVVTNQSKDNESEFVLSRLAVEKEVRNWIVGDLQEGQIINGIVRSIKPYGVFIELAGGIVGLLHIEDISIGRIRDPKERFKIGQKTKVMVKSINRETKQVILTYKELFGTWEENAKTIEEGQILEGIVREPDSNHNGVFIELKPNLIGMTEYQEDLIYGTKVKVCVKKIQKEKKKIKLVIVKDKKEE